jgi:hypothetical protein
MAYDIDGYVPAGMRRDDNYCRHGVYVGGCGIDWMCPACEFGDDEVEDLPPFDFRVAALGRAESAYDGNVRVFELVVDRGFCSRARAVTVLGQLAFDETPGKGLFDRRCWSWFEQLAAEA